MRADSRRVQGTLIILLRARRKRNALNAVEPPES